MDITQVMQLVPKEFYIITVVLYVLGAIMKHMKFIKDELIVFILLILSIIFAVWQGGFSSYTVMYGIIMAGVPVFINNIYRQAGKMTKK